MQKKLTLQLEDALIRKAKRVARMKGQSVSQLVGEYIATQEDIPELDELPPITASMVGILKGQEDVVNQFLSKREQS